MPVASKPTAPAVFDLKSATLTLVALVLRTADAGVLAKALDDRFGDAPALFDGDPVALDLSALRDEEAPIDFAALIALLRERQMLAVAVRGGNPAQMAAAREAGLVEAPDAPPERRAAAAKPPAAQAPSGPASASPPQIPTGASAPALAHGLGQAQAQGAAALSDPAPTSGTAAASTAAPAAAAPTPEPIQPAPTASPTAATPTAATPTPTPTPTPTMVIDRPLRSGQQVYARGCDLVVLAAVNHGAEVIADGHIHVYAPLRGRAVAGAKGNTAARIFSTCMEPELLAIAGTYRTTETPLPADVLGKPAQIRLDGERLVFEPLT